MRLRDRIIYDDCRHYRGDKPCTYGQLCGGCQHYAPYRQRICVIKLGALGDVIRTTCILPELRRRYPNGQITWVSRPNGVRMLADHPMVDRLMAFDAVACMQLAQERFDVAICLDKEPAPCALASAINATTKLGMMLSEAGVSIPANDTARPYFLLGLSDELKFHKNTMSYPQLVYEALGWKYQQQKYELPLNEAEAQTVRRELSQRGWRDEAPTLGVNVGAGSVFANKMWPADRITELLERFHRARPDVQVMLLGGPDELDIMDHLHEQLLWTIHTGGDNSEQRFVAMIDACDVLFCGDTMALHAAVARQRGVVAFIGPTCEQEIDLFGRGEKLIARVDCAPCYKHECNDHNQCLTAVTIERAVDAIDRMMDQMRSEPMRIEPPAPPLRKAG